MSRPDLYGFIDSHRREFDIVVMCRVLAVPRSSFYKWKRSSTSAKQQEDRRLLTRIRQIHAESHQHYGVPRVAAALRRESEVVNHKRVARLMRQAGLRGVMRRGKRPQTTTSNHGLSVAQNVLARDFTAREPNRKWCGDITYVRLRTGRFVYLAIVLDLYSRRIVGWHVGSGLDAGLVVAAQRRAFALRRVEPGRLLMHSDQGSQYASGPFRAELARYGVQQSMSRKGNCHDNAVAESFFATLEVELLQHRRLEDLAEARAVLGRWIEAVYNRRRLHSSIGYHSPVDFEHHYCQ